MTIVGCKLVDLRMRLITSLMFVIKSKKKPEICLKCHIPSTKIPINYPLLMNRT